MIQLPMWLTPNERTALQAFVAALRERYDGQVLSVRLFGSKARGDFDADSDLDVMVLVHDDNWRLAQAISFLAADVSLAHDVLLSPKVVSLTRWDFLNREGFAIARNVQSEGIFLDAGWVARPANQSDARFDMPQVRW
jgi:predicted nucleotidyltransferase